MDRDPPSGGALAPSPVVDMNRADAPAPGSALARVEPSPARLVPMTPREQMTLTLAVFALMVVTFMVLELLALPGWAAPLLGMLAAGLPMMARARGRLALVRARRRLALPGPAPADAGATEGGRGERLAGSEARDDDDALEDLERLARNPWIARAVRCDAAGWAALARLERGSLERALANAAVDLGDTNAPQRGRTPMVGFLGEAARSVLGRLFPEARLTVVDAGALRPARDTPLHSAPALLPELVTCLRALEASGRGDGEAAARAWSELAPARFAARFPVLATLVHGAVLQTRPTAERELSDQLAKLSPRQRALVARRFPDLVRDAGEGYRLPARAPTTHTLERLAPTALRELEPSDGPSLFLPVTSTSVARRALALALIFAVLGALEMQPFLFIVPLAFLPTLVGNLVHRRRRARPLTRAGLRDPARLREFRWTATRSGPRGAGEAMAYPFDRGELMLFVGLARAEDALRAGRPDEARAQIEWWYAGQHEHALRELDTRAIAASLLRVAVLLDMSDQAEFLRRRLTARTSWTWRRRSGHGDAPRALSLATALLYARHGDWARAEEELTSAAGHRPITLDPFERELYGALAERLRRRGHELPPAFDELPAGAPWIDALWPATDDPRPRALAPA